MLKALAIFAMFYCAASWSAPTGRYKTIVDQMNALHASHPARSHIFSIGKNSDGEDILAMRISVTPSVMDTGKIGQLMVATHHGNELAAPTMAMALIRELLNKYDSSDVFLGRWADTEWTVVPVLNISGYNSSSRNEKGYDPNREYPGPCHSKPPTNLASIRLAQQLLASRIYAGSVTVHGYLGAITYPWGVDAVNVQSLDHNAYDRIVAKAASINGYEHGTSTDIVYPCDGSFEDYAYWKHGIWSLLLELQTGSPSDISTSVQAMLAFYDEIDSSPSTQHALTSACRNRRLFDPHME